MSWRPLARSDGQTGGSTHVAGDQAERGCYRTGKGRRELAGTYSQGGHWKRGLWWNCDPTSLIERAGLETLQLRVRAPVLYPTGEIACGYLRVRMESLRADSVFSNRSLPGAWTV